MTRPAIGFDYETFYSSKLKYGLKQMIAETYVRHELFDPYMLAVCDGSESWAGHPREFNWNAIDRRVLVSHNKYFDKTVYDETVRRGWIPKIELAGWHCTANLTSFICNRRALDDAVEFLYKVKVDKSARANADGKRWPKDFSEAEQAAMLKYAPLDAYWCQKIWTDYSAQWPEIEQRLSNITIEQGMRGIQIDTELLGQYIVQAHEMKTMTEKALPWIAGADDPEWDDFSDNIKPTSTKCIAEQCRKAGIPCPPVKAHDGADAFEEWEAVYGPKHPWIAALSSWRSINKLYKTMLLVKSRLRDDGTIPFGLKYFGAHTGRWSGSEKINLQNPRKKPVFARQDGLMETDESAGGLVEQAMKQKKVTGSYPDWVRYAIDFRALLIPRPGYKMICSDLSQIEPRVLAWLTGNRKLMQMIAEGMSVYEAFARANLGYDKSGKMDKDSDYYKLVKIMVLGLGYQAGWEKFITIAKTGGLDVTADDPETITTIDPFTDELIAVPGYGKRSKEIVKEFREKSPGTVALWEKLDEAFKRSIGSDFRMMLPSGRYMTYRNVRSSTRISVDKKTGKPKKEHIYTAESDGRRVQFYGGKLTENLVQATARDIFGHHIVDLVDAGHWVLFTSHDEAICECKLDVKAEDVASIMGRCPDWIEGCPIAADAKEVAHYTK